MQNARYNILPKGKKGINDISIIAILTFILFATAIIIPFVNEEFNIVADNFDTEGFEANVKNDAESVTAFSAFTVLVTVLKLALFDVGNSLGLPFWLDAIYTVIGIILILVIGRNIWVGGGA